MGGDRVVMQAKAGIFDQYRGVFLNRGVFVKAPPGFFQDYPSQFAKPPLGWEKLKITLREIPAWDPKVGLLARQQVEVPVPPQTPVTSAVVVETAAAKPMAEKPVMPENTIETEGDASPAPRRRGRPPGSKNKPKTEE